MNTDHTMHSTNHPKSFRTFSGIIALLFALLMAACQTEEPDGGVTVGDIEDDPEAYAGQTVAVSGQIDEVYAGDAFAIGGDVLGEDLLVVPSAAGVRGGRAGDRPFEKDDTVQVTGTVVRYGAAEIEREYEMDLVEELSPRLEGQEPVLVAESIDLAPRAGGPVTDLTMLTGATATAELAGTRVELDDVVVHEVASDTSFWVGPSPDRRLFVVVGEDAGEAVPEGETGLAATQRVSLTGTVRRMPSVDTLRAQWGTDAVTAAALQDEAIYLRAGGVSPAQQ